jgi:hypothetical protein
MTNPNNAVGTDGAYGGRTSVNAFNDNLAQYSSGVLNGWDIAAGGGMSVDMGGNGIDRDVAVAEDNAGNKTTINNISGSPINVPIATAAASNDRLDVIVAYVDNPPTGNDTDIDNPGACGIIAVEGIASGTPVAPDDTAIRTAITADGASGATAYYAILYTIKVKAGITVIDNSAWVFTGNTKPWAKVQGNRFLADRSVKSEQIGLNQVRSSNIDWTTMSLSKYSSTEQATEMTWLNGETIYSKTVYFGALPNGGVKDVAHGITYDRIIDVRGFAQLGNGTVLPLPFVNIVTLNYGIVLLINSTNISIDVGGADRSGATAYITIYYTKSS